MTHLTRLVVLITTAAMPTIALAHDGHASPGIWHYFSTPHIVPIAAGLVVAILIARRLWLRSQR